MHKNMLNFKEPQITQNKMQEMWRDRRDWTR